MSQVVKEGFLPLHITYFPEKFLNKAKIELGETLENKKNCLQDLKILIEKDKTLQDIDFHPDMLQMFLRHSKYNTKKAFTRLQNYIAFKRKNIDYFIPIPYEIAKRKFSKVATTLPFRTEDGCAVVLFQHGFLNEFIGEENTINEFERLGMSIIQQCLRYPMTQLNGFVGIHDFKNVTLKLARQPTPSMMYRFVQAYMNCVPARYKEVHVVNEPFICKFILQVLKPLLPAKLRERIFIHSHQEELLNHFPRCALPEKYGGDLKEYHMADFIMTTCEEMSQCPLGGQPHIAH